MEKIEVKKDLKIGFDWSDISISDLRRDLDYLESKGATKVEISADCDGLICFVAQHYVIETDEELKTKY